MKYIIARLREPSTRLAIAGILGVIAPMIPAYTIMIQAAATLIAGHVAVTPDPAK